MMHGSRIRGLLSAALVLAAASARATDGYFSHGFGTPYKAMAGAGSALPLGTWAPATNPAGLAFVGDRYDIGIAVFNPNREYSVSGGPSGFPGTFGLATGTVESGSRYFPLPSLGGSWAIGPKVVLGMALYGNGGMNTDYAASTFGGGPTGVDMAQMFAAPTLAYTLTPDHALGVTAVLAYQRFEAKGLASFAPMSSDPTHLTDLDHASSWGAGLRLGYQGRLTSWLRLGASYQTRVNMTEFDEYAGLFAEKGGFDIPQNLVGGIALIPLDNLTLAFDVQWIDYDSVRSVGNDFLPNLMQAPLGAAGAAGFGWHDMTVYKAGVQLETGTTWTWRAGYSYGQGPIRSNEVLINILAPGVMEHHVSAGVTKILSQGKALNLAITRALPASVSGPNNLDAPGFQSIELSMDQWEIDLSYSFGF
jgi:long-chain fatty acid transport protein